MENIKKYVILTHTDSYGTLKFSLTFCRVYFFLTSSIAPSDHNFSINKVESQQFSGNLREEEAKIL